VIQQQYRTLEHLGNLADKLCEQRVKQWFSISKVSERMRRQGFSIISHNSHMVVIECTTVLLPTYCRLILSNTHSTTRLDLPVLICFNFIYRNSMFPVFRYWYWYAKYHNGNEQKRSSGSFKRSCVRTHPSVYRGPGFCYLCEMALVTIVLVLARPQPYGHTRFNRCTESILSTTI
jgi:hypothetical protein